MLRSTLEQAGFHSGDVCLIRIAKQGSGGYYIPPYGTEVRPTDGPWSNIARFTLP